MNEERTFSPSVGQTIFALLLAVVVACTPAGAQGDGVPTPTPATDDAATTEATPLPGNLDSVTFIEDGQVYTIHQLIPRDGIYPIYEPQFVSAEEAEYSPNELVMGVEINGDARAYPVGVLQQREMVNDVVGGRPILVTW